MPQPLILPPNRTPCAESLLSRAWASAYYRQPANYLRLLLDVLDSPRPLYRRMAVRALASGEVALIAAATAAVQQEINRCKMERAKVQAAMPLLYSQAA